MLPGSPTLNPIYPSVSPCKRLEYCAYTEIKVCELNAQALKQSHADLKLKVVALSASSWLLLYLTIAEPIFEGHLPWHAALTIC